MISIPIAVYNSTFKWQLELFWYNHKLTYGNQAKNKALAVIIKRNNPRDVKVETYNWDIDIPYVMCESFFDYLGSKSPQENNVPLNIQIGLKQIIDQFDDDQLLELIDCDMCHIKHHPTINLDENQIITDPIYEAWHLKSLGDNRNVIEEYFVNEGKYYNGGFVPIIGKAKTFKKILPDWIDIHTSISNKYNDQTQWWAGMFALQAACERNKTTMIPKNWCYVPEINSLNDDHYIVHYSVSKKFNKKNYPRFKTHKFDRNIFFDRLKSWIDQRRSIRID